MNVTQAIRSCTRRVLNKQPVLIVGGAGVGKTSVAHAVAKNTKHELLISYPALSDPTAANGIPYPSKDGKSASFLPYGVLAQALKATKPTIWLMDDFGQATAAVQAAHMHLLLSRRVDEHVLPDCVTIIATTNRKGDKAGVVGLLEPVKSRFVTMVELDPDFDTWLNWAYVEGLSPIVLAYLQANPDMFYKPAPSLDLVNTPSPRTWHNASSVVLAGLDEEESVVLEEFKGAVGLDAATSLLTFSKVAHEMPDLDNMLLYPQKCALSKDLTVLMLTASALAQRTTTTNIKAIGVIAKRLVELGHGELAAMMVLKSAVVCPKVEKTAAYTALVASPEISELL